MREIPDDNLKYPVLVKYNEISIGSGVFLSSDNEVYFITAKHVLFPDDKPLSKVKLLSYPKESNLSNEIELNIESMVQKNNILSHKTADIVVAKIGKRDLIEGTSNYKLSFFEDIIQTKNNGIIVSITKNFIKKYEEVIIANDVFLMGYPSSLSTTQQIESDKPLLRKGIIAGKNDTKKSIIIDCPVYQGNSGGPVIQVEEVQLGQKEFRLIGLAIEFVPFVEVTESKHFKYQNIKYENSGYSVVAPIDHIIDIIEKWDNYNLS